VLVGRIAGGLDMEDKIVLCAAAVTGWASHQLTNCWRLGSRAVAAVDLSVLCNDRQLSQGL